MIDKNDIRNRRVYDTESEPNVDEILALEGISKSDIEKYQNYSMFYRALQAVLKHKRPSPETVSRLENLERMIGEHIKDEMFSKDAVLNAIKELTRTVSEMKPTVKKVSDLDTFLSVGNRIGWIILLMVLAALVGLYHFWKDVVTWLR